MFFFERLIDDEWAVAVDKVTSGDSSDNKSFISIIGIDKREEAFKTIYFQKSKEF